MLPPLPPPQKKGLNIESETSNGELNWKVYLFLLLHSFISFCSTLYFLIIFISCLVLSSHFFVTHLSLIFCIFLSTFLFHELLADPCYFLFLVRFPFSHFRFVSLIRFTVSRGTDQVTHYPIDEIREPTQFSRIGPPVAPAPPSIQFSQNFWHFLIYFRDIPIKGSTPPESH